MVESRDDECSKRPESGPANQHNGRRRWIVGALLAQLFLVSVYVAILTSGRAPMLVATSLAFMLAFSGVYVLVVGRVVQAQISRRRSVVGLLFVLTLPQLVMLGPDAAALWIFVAVAGGMLFRDRAAFALALALAGLMLILDAVAGQPLSWELAMTLIALTAFMVGFAGNVRLNIKLRETQEQLAVAAVAAERERIGRDLHDILGHSLTAIAVKAGLARRLLDRDSTAAATEIADVERLAREALADVRATASGYREVSLATELAVAGAVLRAAGIRPVLPRAVDDVDPAAREVLGYVVREAVTNVVRHSGARTSTITLSTGAVEISDDGAFGELTSPGHYGSGLHGLADRISARDGTFEAGPRPGGGFFVRATVPAGSAPADSAPADSAPAGTAPTAIAPITPASSTALSSSLAVPGAATPVHPAQRAGGSGR